MLQITQIVLKGFFHGVIVVFLGEQTLSLLCHLCVKKTKYCFV